MMQIQRKKINLLSSYKNNARQHPPEQIKQIEHSIKEFGFNVPVLIDEKNTIIAGHGRIEAAVNLGLTEVPAIKINHLSDKQKQAFILADNKIAMNATWDIEILSKELTLLNEFGFDVKSLGFDNKELNDLLADSVNIDEKVDLDEIPSIPSRAMSADGDIWKLGNHRLFVGNSTDSESFNKLLGKKQIDCVWTDPPYNVDYTSSDGKSIINDNLNDDEFYRLIYKSLMLCFEHTKAGGAIYVAHAEAGLTGTIFRQAMLDAGWSLKQVLIWVKNHFTLSRQDYQWQHEPILYGWKPGAAHSWFAGFDQKTVIDYEKDIGDMNKDELKEFALHLVRERATTVIRENKPIKNPDHPTMKPINLVKRLVKNNTKQKDMVFDPFGGSGSTLIACEITGRQCRTIELDPRYADVIIKRWEKLTNKEAQKL